MGPAPTDGGGVTYMSTQVLRSLPSLDVEVEAFFTGPREDVPSSLAAVTGLSCHPIDSGWRYDRWYSSTELTKLLSGMGTRAAVQGVLAQRLAARHREVPFDVVYQFSQLELLGLAAVRRRLPPIVVHPEVHAQGELRWLQKESAFLPDARAKIKNGVVEQLMRLRATVQRRDICTVERVVAPSRVFASELQRDYGLSPERVTVVPNPIDPLRFSDTGIREWRPPWTFVFVSRMSVRKGVDVFRALAGRLHDLGETVRLVAIGGHSQWSDYRHLLADLPPHARYVGPLSSSAVQEALSTAHGFLQPSKYEPFALTVGEALASGLPGVVSTAVGAGEWISPPALLRHDPESLDDLETSLRQLVGWYDAGRGPELSAAAVTGAKAFAPQRVAGELRSVLTEASGRAPEA
jgi:glycosyltransferase involved in cell wall biosynthesis